MAAKTPTKPAASNQSRIILGVVFGVVALALILAIVFSGGDSGDGADGSAEFGQPVISGASLAVVEDATVGSLDDPAVGTPIPEITGQDFDGTTVEISKDGQPKAILFVSHSCPHCQDEIPEVQRWLNETGGVAGVDIISVSTSAAEVGGNWPPSAWLERENWTSPVIADDEESSTFAAFGGWVIPYWVFVDSDGIVTRRWAGRMDLELLELAMLETLS